jgi:hypothetical protein
VLDGVLTALSSLLGAETPSTRNFKVGFDARIKNLSLKISRADVAYFMVEQLSSDKFIKKTISISN